MATKTIVKKPTVITSQVLNTLRPQIEESYGDLFKKNNIDAKVKIGVMRFNQESFRFKTVITLNTNSSNSSQHTVTGSSIVVSENPEVASKKREWDLYCHVYGFDPEEFGKEFYNHLNEKCKITGLKPKNKKHAILYDVIDSRTKKQHMQRKASPDYVRARLDKYPVPTLVQQKNICNVCKKEIDKSQWFPGCLTHSTCIDVSPSSTTSNNNMKLTPKVK